MHVSLACSLQKTFSIFLPHAHVQQQKNIFHFRSLEKKSCFILKKLKKQHLSSRRLISTINTIRITFYRFRNQLIKNKIPIIRSNQNGILPVTNKRETPQSKRYKTAIYNKIEPFFQPRACKYKEK